MLDYDDTDEPITFRNYPEGPECASCGFPGAAYRHPGDPRVFCDRRCWWTRREEAIRRELERDRQRSTSLVLAHESNRGARVLFQCPACQGYSTRIDSAYIIANPEPMKVRRAKCDCGVRFNVPYAAEWPTQLATKQRMQCPVCKSRRTFINGQQRGKKRIKCRDCGVRSQVPCETSDEQPKTDAIPETGYGSQPEPLKSCSG